MKKRTGDDWFPFWIDKWIFGSTRDELTVEECAVWIDFLALSYKDDGYIRANVGIPYPIKRLSGLLNRSEKLIQQLIDKCLDPKINKLRLEPDGTLYVLSHPEYELSSRHKRRLEAEDPCEEEISSEAAARDYLQSAEIQIALVEWNKFAKKHDLAEIQEIKKKTARRKHLIVRLREGLKIEEILEIIEKSPFLLGKTKAGFRVFFDWIILPTNYQKIVEGNYLDRKFSSYRTWLLKKRKEERKK